MKYNFLIFFVMLVACNDEADSAQVVSWANLSEKHNIKGLLSYDYNKADKVFILGYSFRYEIRDENFNILKTVKLDFDPYSILYTRDSIYASNNFQYFPTSNDMIMVANERGSITLFNPVTKESKLLYTDPAAPLYQYSSFNAFVETDQYYILSIRTATSCVFIDKSTYEATSFTDTFKKYNSDGGTSVVKTRQGDIILSIALSGFIVDDYLIYKNGTWEQFQPTLPNTDGKMGFVDSRNYAWINNPNNTYFKLYDLTTNSFVTSNPPLLSGNFFGYTLREHTSGDILVKSGTLTSVTYELMQIHFN